MSKDFVAKKSITINVPISRVWDALVNPKLIKQYMFGTDVVSDWKQGSPIVWKGEWQGKSYEDRGIILRIEPERLIEYTHFSPLSGVPDVPENYHTVTVELSPAAGGVRLSLSQANNPTDEARKHSESNWEMMLKGMRSFLEG
ncbi:MAG TPA: SRPBCC family protein [Candidatus Kryptonia bacterium]